MKAGNFLSFQEQYVFWRLTNYFLGVEKYRLIHLHEEKQELWLENTSQKKRPVIRIQMKELSWANVVERDVTHTLHVTENLRKQMGRLKLPLVNIYITPFEPMGDISPFFGHSIASPNEKVKLENILLANEQMREHLDILIKTLELPEEAFVLPTEITKELVAKEREQVIAYITTKVNEEQKVARNSKPIVTYIFLGLLVAAFLWLSFQGGTTNSFNLIKWGGKFNPLIYAGEWWRFISPIFLHSGLMHLASNAVMLYIVGAWAERIYGKWRYVLILLLGGICGNIASFALNMNLSVGASTAVFAVMGALLYLVVLKPNLYAKTIGVSIASLVAINLLIDVFSSQIDIAGHIGGLVGGFLLAGALSLPKQFFHWRRLAYGISLFAVAILFLYFGYQKGEQPYDPMQANVAVQQYLQEQNKKEATKITDNLISSGSADGYSYTYASSIALQDKQVDKAEAMAKEAINIDKDIPEAHYYLSVCYRIKGDMPNAIKEANSARELSSNPFFDSYYDELEKIKE